ncbi:MAG: acyl-CoA thioesterase [Melioribacteraceae bacterium]|nr:acyl-CoA thioesterase [Melioribacteraceae bacterium]
MNLKTKTVKDSVITMTELVLPQHTNQLGNLLGGQLMHWIDICAAMAAAKHSETVCVTASVDNIDFHNAVHLGEVITLKASVNRTFSSSMEVGVNVISENFKEGKTSHTNSAYLTFVKLNDDRKPEKTFEIIPETDDEKRRHKEAMRRRKNRLKSLPKN